MSSQGRTELPSDNIHTVRYLPGTRTLEVTFRAAPYLLYSYANVEPEMYADLLSAESHGRWFNVHIRRRPDLHPYTRSTLP